MEDISEEYLEKPLPNEHSCRLKDPKQFDTCKRVSRNHKGKRYSVIYCKKGNGPMQEQAYRYPKSIWEAAEARAHCKAHNGKSFEPAKEIDIDFEEENEKDINREVIIELKTKDTDKEIKEKGEDIKEKDKEIEEKDEKIKEENKESLEDILAPLLARIDALEEEIKERSKPKSKVSEVSNDYDTKVTKDNSNAKEALASLVERWKAGDKLTSAERDILDNFTRRAFENLPTADLDNFYTLDL